ncbi:PIR Superfamily Protein [Plasmodium ovale curtisi]|uniref:PIR Superfamily Protein n=1 Tax=Plasmodium ovale curtisi TaxID=864141 RepID=A0A1A8WV72_PLAOA|nr:PIR Superfamily Protein [Plasmodium ovale curtisi]
MESTDCKICELPSEKNYKMLDNVGKADSYEKYCNIEDNILDNYPDLKLFCSKFVSHLENFKKHESNNGKHCISLKHWIHDKVIKTVEKSSVITYILLFYTILVRYNDDNKNQNEKQCKINFPFVSIDHLEKRKKMYDYNDNYKELICAFQKKVDCKESGTEDSKEIFKVDCNEVCKEDCKEKYCKYFVDIFNLYNEFEQVCRNATENRRCPEFWETFKKNYSAISDIEEQCKNVYEELGFYKVKVYFGEEDIEKYVEQYASTYMFSFFEKLIGYSIKYYLSKTIHYSKYVLLPILSFFGSKIAPKADGMRNMWRNVQGVTNPASLLNPMKPPGGGNKMGLPYLPK